MAKIFLCGGFHSGWQDKVIEEVPQHIFYDPRKAKGFDDAKIYSKSNLDAISYADWILAYLEKTNPAGHNLAFEIGFAKGLGIPIVFVNESEIPKKYLGMIIKNVNVNCSNLDLAINFFKYLRG